MAILLDDADTEYLRGTAPSWATISMWFYPDDLGAGLWGLWTHRNALNTKYYRLYIAGATDRVSYEAVNTGLNLIVSTGTVNLNAWNHLVLLLDTVASPAQARLSLNGAAFDSVTSTQSPAVTTVEVGRNGAAGTYFSGRVAELAYWNWPLNYDANTQASDDYKALALGYTPLEVRPEYLTNYWPFFIVPGASTKDLVARTTLTLQYGADISVSADHCRRIEFSGLGAA